MAKDSTEQAILTFGEMSERIRDLTEQMGNSFRTVKAVESDTNRMVEARQLSHFS